MATITARDVKRLRDQTGAGMMDCKKALVASDGDIEAAVDLLRKKGQKVAAKRAGREASEGLIVTALSGDRRFGIMVEVNCETDFVARNEEFSAFAAALAELILTQQPADLDELSRLMLSSNRTVSEVLSELTGKIGEKLAIRRFSVLGGDADCVVGYIHPGSRLGVLVALAGAEASQAVGRDVAMQVAAMNPVAVRRSDVPDTIRDKELEIGRETARLQGKPEKLWDRIAQGKLNRFYKDHVLVEQVFVKDSAVTVQQMLQRAQVDVQAFVRFALGA